MHGPVDPGTLIALLRALFQQQKSGILELTRGSEARKILLQKGVIKFASTTVAEERLGEYLVRCGRLKAADLEKATRQVGRGERVGQILVRLGLLTQEELVRFAREHILQIIYACFRMEGGEYRFEEMDVPLGQEIKAGLSMGAIIMEAVRRMEPGAAAAALGGGGLVLRPTTDARYRSQPIALLPQEGYLLSRVDGRATLDEIVVMSPLPAQETLQILYGLWCAGLIEDPADPTRLPVASALPRETSRLRPAEALHASPTPTLPSAAPAPPPAAAASRPAAGSSAGGSAKPAAATAAPKPPPSPSRPVAPKREAVREAAPVRSAPGVAPQDRAREVIDRLTAAESQSLYELLGVLQAAEETDIRHAYYTLAKRFHPDRFQGPEAEPIKHTAERLFSMLTEAYNVLSDPEARQRYDQERSAPAQEPVVNRVQEQANLARQNFLHGKALLEQGQFHNAVTFFENAVQQDPTKAEHHQYLASVQMKNPKWRQDAERNFLRALEIDPSLVPCYLSLGQIYRRTGREELAQQMFRQALQWDPDQPVAKRELAEGSVAKATAGKSSLFKGIFKR